MFLLRALQHPVSFNSIFKFHGNDPPWANELAQIVGYLDGEAVPVDTLGDTPSNPGLGVVHYAANIKDVIDWLETPDSSPAVLVPSAQFGPDIMVRCRDVLLMGQVKFYMVGDKDSLDAKTISNVLASLQPNHWFKSAVCPLV